VTHSAIELTEAETSRLIEMAWEDRTTFEAIEQQFGLKPGQVIEVMRRELKSSSFRMWRARTAGRLTKHSVKGRCPIQRDALSAKLAVDFSVGFS
jgi:uncharacterized protein (TIGR03643 family)